MTKIFKTNEEIECPICNEKHIIDLYNSVNVQHNPELKDKVFAGEINTLPCAKGYIIGKLLYVDGNQWIWIYPSYMKDDKDNIELQINEQRELDKRMFGNDSANISLVFGYDQFQELIAKLDEGSE